jgi:hypothetical protein
MVCIDGSVEQNQVLSDVSVDRFESSGVSCDDPLGERKAVLAAVGETLAEGA